MVKKVPRGYPVGATWKHIMKPPLKPLLTLVFTLASAAAPVGIFAQSATLDNAPGFVGPPEDFAQPKTTPAPPPSDATRDAATAFDAFAGMGPDMTPRKNSDLRGSNDFGMGATQPPADSVATKDAPQPVPDLKTAAPTPPPAAASDPKFDNTVESIGANLAAPAGQFEKSYGADTPTAGDIPNSGLAPTMSAKAQLASEEPTGSLNRDDLQFNGNITFADRADKIIRKVTPNLLPSKETPIPQNISRGSNSFGGNKH